MRSSNSLSCAQVCLTVIAVFVLMVSPANATDKCGAVCDETWALADSPFVITCSVTVATGCALAIDAGIEVRAQSGTALQISGNLDVNGSSGNEVVFTSDAGAPAVGDWSGVQLLSSSTGTLHYATVSWADNGVHVAGTATSATLDHVTVSDNDLGVYVHSFGSATLTDVTATSNVDGLHVYESNNAQVDVSGGSFTGNGRYGVYVDAYWDVPTVTVSGASIHSNLGSHDFYVNRYPEASEHVVLARGNWWGTSDPAAIGPRIYDLRSSTHSYAPIVDWCAYLDGPGGVEPDVECPDLAICDETASWDVTTRPYQLTSDLVVCPTGTLTIGPGVEVRTVKTSPKPEFRVLGTLDVNGTSGSEVLLTSDAGVPAVGDWSGVHLRSGGTGTLDYATASWADIGLLATGSGTSATLDHVTATDNEQGIYVNADASATLTEVTATSNVDGLYVYTGNDTMVYATGGSFTGNERYGVNVYGWGYTPTVSVSGAEIHSNLGSYDFYASGYPDPEQHVVLARGNWWGTDDPAAIGSRIYDRRKLHSSPIVDWCAYLDGPGGVARDVECPDLAVCDETASWSVTSRPYLLTSYLVVCPTGTLVIDEGVEVRTVFTSPAPVFKVDGTLDINGTPGSEVVLTSDEAEPWKGSWNGPRLRAGSTSTLDHVEVSWADEGVGVEGSGTSAALSHVTVSHNNEGVLAYNGPSLRLMDVTATANTDGLFVRRGSTTQVDVSGGRFTENDRYGVYVDGFNDDPSPSVTLCGASIHSNLGTHDLYTHNFVNAASTLLWAPDTWWGTSSEYWIGQRIYDQEDNASSPVVWLHPFGPSCEMAVGRDVDGDSLGDYDDNCPVDRNFAQTDADADGMGDDCDPEPGTQPGGPCNGIDDTTDGFADADADGWGDPCDFQPTQANCYPGAPEICDGHDNDGDAIFALDELVDVDRDGAIACADCDDVEPEVYPCACESCTNVREDDCDGLMDAADPDCFTNPYCVVVTAGTPEPGLHVDKGACGGATTSGPFDVIRGHVSGLQLSAGSVDLGEVVCVAGNHGWDRVSDLSPDPNPGCNDALLFHLARDTGAPDFGTAHPGNEPRDVMNPDPACP